MAKSEQQKAKEKLDKIFSQFIRLRDSDNDGYCECITCGSRCYWEKDGIQNGHYLHRGLLITRFDEDNCHAQCENCNLWRNKNEMQITYREALVDEIGENKVKKLENKRHKTFIIDIIWYKEKIEFYTEKVLELKKERGIL